MQIFRVFLLVVFVGSYSCFAQNRNIKTDTMGYKKNVKPLVTKLDSIKIPKETLKKVFGIKTFNEKEIPKIVFVRSLMLPGWGQATNKQYFMLPIIYGAAFSTYYFGIRSNNKQFEWYKKSLGKLIEIERNGITANDGVLISGQTAGKELYIGNESKFQTVYALHENKYYELKDDLSAIKVDNASELVIKGPFTQQIIENGANQFRRYRDLSIIGMAVGWTIFAVQANVTAHLKSFDMSENISVKFEPVFEPGILNANLGGKLVLNLK